MERREGLVALGEGPRLIRESEIYRSCVARPTRGKTATSTSSALRIPDTSSARAIGERGDSHVDDGETHGVYDERWTRGLVFRLFSGRRRKTRVGLYDMLGQTTMLKNNRRLTCRSGEVLIGSGVRQTFVAAQDKELPVLVGPGSVYSSSGLTPRRNDPNQGHRMKPFHKKTVNAYLVDEGRGRKWFIDQLQTVNIPLHVLPFCLACREQIANMVLVSEKERRPASVAKGTQAN